MDTVRTFVNYTGLTGNDPFDDLRRLNYCELLATNDIEYGEFMTRLIEMTSALRYARTNQPIDAYVPDYELKAPDGHELGIVEAIEDVMKSFRMPNDDYEAKNDDESDDIDVNDELHRALARHKAFRKRNTVNMLLSNAIAIGASLDVIMSMEYVQAVNFVNYRYETLKKQQDEAMKEQTRR